MTSSKRNSYSSILKSIGLFGGVKLFQILVGIIKNKVAAVLLGPSGIGIIGLITSTIQLVSTFTGFGLQTSAVRGIASSTNDTDTKSIGRIVYIIRKLVIITGLLGMTTIFLFAKYLSVVSFGNEDFSLAFRIVCIVAFFDQVCIGQTALMQGTFHYNLMARSALWGSIVGLIISIPLYYLWCKDAIVPVIIVSSFSNLLISTYYSHKIEYVKIRLQLRSFWEESKGMLILGLAIAMSGVVGLGTTYLLRVFISNTGSINDVGLYTAGATIATQYVNLILASMSSDYSPRLAAVSNNVGLFITTINRQMKLMVTIITPLLVLFIVLIREITILLYSDEFLSITSMIEWMMFGMFFRTTSWCLSYALVARGDSRTFFINELISSLYTLLLSAVGFKLLRFSGLGIAFCLSNILYTIQMSIMGFMRFGYRVSNESMKVCLYNLICLCMGFFSLLHIGYCNYRYFIGSSFFIFSMIISFSLLNKMIPLVDTMRTVVKKIGL